MSDIGGAREEAKANARISELEEQLRKARRDLSKAQLKEQAVVSAVFDAAYQARLAQGAIAPVKAPTHDDRMRGEHVALWDLGDWQGTKVTTTYNTAVMRARVRLFLDKAEYFLEEQKRTRPVRHGVVVFGGDMIEGLWNYPTQAWEIEAEPIDQVVVVADLMVEVVQRALAMFETVQVVPEWGNHGRVGSKRDAVPRWTNLDRMALIVAMRDLEHEKAAGRLVWEDSKEDIQTLEIGEYRALVLHGDEIGRNGYASPQTILRHVDRWKSGSFKRAGKPWKFQDAYVHHYHTPMEMTTADGVGRVFFNGSTESDNRYAMEQMAAAGLPTQRLHFIDPDRGLVVQRLDILLED